MGRPAKFSSEQILDAAARLVAEAGPGAATVAAIAARLGAPSGSVYYRFPARDRLLAELWIRLVRRAQHGFLELLDTPAPGVGVEAALHVVRWSRAHPNEAQVLLLYRREDLAARWPDDLGDELAGLNDGLRQRLRSYTRWLTGSVSARGVERVTFALVDVPYGAVRRHLEVGRPPPPSLDELVTATVRHLLGDRA